MVKAKERSPFLIPKQSTPDNKSVSCPYFVTNIVPYMEDFYCVCLTVGNNNAPYPDIIGIPIIDMIVEK